MTTWYPKRIGQLGRVVTGKTPPTDNPEYFGGDELFVSPKDLERDGFYIDETTTRITDKALDKFKNQVLPRNTVMFTSLSFAFGKMGIVSRPCLTNQQINSIVVNDDHNFLFVYYLLRAYEPIIFSYNSGIDTPIVPKSVFEGIEVKVPNRPIQDKIAAILSAYDVLIENNRRRIGLLEKMAEEIYREWFVRMRFPGHEVARFSKGLPEGWLFEEIGFVTDFVSRGIAPDYDETASSTVINQKCVRDGRIDLAPARNLKNEIPTAKCLQVGDVLINSTGTGTLGRVAQVLEPLKNTTVDTHLTIVRPSKKVTQHFFGMQLMQMEKHFTALGDGATNQTELKRELIRSSKIVLPAEPLMLEFDRICAPIRQQSCQLQSQIKCLKQTRDVLLPRLISGKLSIEALDIQVPSGIQAV